MRVAFLAEWASPYQWAAEYRRHGLQVVPGRTGEKYPLMSWKEFQSALVPQTQFDRWFHPETGEHRMQTQMGLLTGACSRGGLAADETEGLLLVDCDIGDGKNGIGLWQAFIEVELNGIEPETWRARSGGGGLHIFFRAPPGRIPPTFKTASGVDVRGQGGYVVVAPSVHPNGKPYEWIEGFEPWSVPLAMAPVELCDWLEKLRLEHGGGATGPREHTAPPEGVTNAFGLQVDDREHKIAAMVWAAVVDLHRESPIPPPQTVQEAEIKRLWDQYELTTKSRLETDPEASNADLLEREGRGLTLIRQKWLYAIGRWHTKVAEAAKVPKPEAANDWGDRLAASFAELEADPTLGPVEEGRPFRATVFQGDPPERRWLVDGWIARGEVNSLYGGGATGKSLLALQLCYSTALGMRWLGLETAKATSLFISCEDDTDELHRRHTAIKAGLGYPIGNPFDPVELWDRVGHNNLLASLGANGALVGGAFLAPLRAALDETRPDLLVLDTLADVYGGSEIDRVQVNGFLKTCLGGLIRERPYELTILLLGHPSKSALADGSGFSGSTAWENGVRSRLYLSRPDDSGPDERILTRAKANYAGGDNDSRALIWSNGVFAGYGGESGVGQMARTVRNEVSHAWNAGFPYTEKHGHPRNLHVAIVRRLLTPEQPRELILAGIREAIDERLIVASRTMKKRGWKANDDA